MSVAGMTGVALGRPVGTARWLAIGLLVAVAAAIPLGLDGDGYVMRVLTMTLLFATLGQAWNMIGGLANQLSLGHAAFFGVGAYTSTILLRDLNVSPWLGMGAGAALAAVAALLLSVPTFRLRGHYFALATLAFGEVMRVIAISWSSMTGGPVGISVPYLPDGSFAMMQFSGAMPYYYITLVALILVTGLFWWMKESALGYRLRAIRENPEAAEVIGVDTYRTKLIASVVSAMVTACLGVIYAQFNYFFDPDQIFSLASVSVKIALTAIIGGVGLVFGPILGAFLIVPFEELANATLGGRAAGLSAFAYGLVLIALILLQPRGLVYLIIQISERFGGKDRS
ncbi:branched-chain amino acid ABC transporter permease [Fodinicurvata sp. EGI_FJ10296]|uniref:branched-chain amino acid ABC transporter permease n=1 Tax=Fodinicurvata sp. EGI_FJ10296 TaxID=3231908 RepID=UPI0034567E54